MKHTSSTTGVLRRCLLPLVLRALVFLIVGSLGLFLLTKYVVAVQDKIFDYRGDASTAGRIFVFVLFVAAEVMAIAAAVAATNFLEGSAWLRTLRGGGGSVAAGQKILLICLVLQLLILPAWQSAYVKSFVAIAFATYLLTLGLGFSLWRQVFWICLGLLPTFLTGLFAVVDLRGPDASLFLRQSLPVGLVLVQLIAILMLSRRASRSLRSKGAAVKFFGMPFREIPALFEDSGSSVLEDQPLDPQREQSGSDNPSTTSASPQFYYLGPNNEPIGPIPPEVLLQLRESRVVTDDTLVAPVGESEWKPLRSFLEITQEEST